MDRRGLSAQVQNKYEEALTCYRQALQIKDDFVKAHNGMAVVHLQRMELAPALEQLNSVTAMLQKNNDNIGKSMAGIAKFQVTQAEAVNNGYFYNAFVANLSPAQTIQPFIDYIFGFRRGVNNGQPPDNAGPRAEFPFPNNSDPEPWRRVGQVPG
jgi:phospholipid/cholesterol/gamma-HCH transport system substrate-binding protein